jgi:hypothetical protein
VPDGTQHPFLSADQIGGDPVSYNWSGVRNVVSVDLPPPIEGATAVHSAQADHVVLEAEARFAELAAQHATEAALAKTRIREAAPERDPADPLDQVAADWAANVNADEKIIHAFLGIDDPVGREAEELFDDIAVDAELSAFLETLPEGHLAHGELAALTAFDEALARGADAEEALSAAIRAADTRDVSDDVPPQNDAPAVPIDTASLSPADGLFGVAPEERPVEEVPRQPNLEPAPYSPPLPALSLIGLSGLGAGGSILADPAFGFGFSFSFDAIPLHKPGEDALPHDERNDPEDTDSAVDTVISYAGSADADLLVGTSSSEVFGSKEGDDFVYTDLPTNYDATLHTAANPLANPIFSASGGDDIASAGSGDDSIWGGAGDDQLHGDVPDVSSALSSEFSFPLGLTTGGNDVIDGGAGDDTLWGGDGADTLIGGDGQDTLYGDGGVDTLYGGDGADGLFGYAGDDILSSGGGDDTLAGGDGADSFEFSGGSGASAFERAQSLGTDTVSDYSSTDNDTFALANDDFGLGNSGTLSAGTDYFETASLALGAGAQDMSGGVANAGIVVVGANTGSDGAGVYYTDDASAMTNMNSYQIADILSVNASDFEAADFLLK